MPHHQCTVIALPRRAKRARIRILVAATVLPTPLAGTALPAHAVAGCLVLLCFAAPRWQAIAQCVPPIREALRDLARGRAFSTCAMSGPDNSATHR